MFYAIFNCIVLFTTVPSYSGGSYSATLEATCDKPSQFREFSERKDEEDLTASLEVTQQGNKIKAVSYVRVKRPWIAPIDIFMSVAEGKHKSLVEEKLGELYGSK